MKVETLSFEKLVSMLQEPPEYIITLRFRGVHAYLSNALRLLDLRGRNAMLVLLRKLAALVLLDAAKRRSCSATVLRCGGNAIHIALGCKDKHLASEVYDLAKKLAELLAAVLTPMTIQVELLRVERRSDDNRVELSLVESDTLYPDVYAVTPTLYIGNRLVDTHVMCPVCGETGIGVDSAISRSRIVLHIVQEDRRLCARDFMFRVVGRGFNSPGIVTIFVPDLKVTLLKQDTAEIVLSLTRDTKLKVSFVRHAGSRNAPECIRNLDDIVVVSLSLEESTYAAVVIGLAPQLAKNLIEKFQQELKQLRDSCKCDAMAAKEFTKIIHEQLLKDYRRISRLFDTVREIVGKHICGCDLRNLPSELQRFSVVLEPLREKCDELLDGLAVVPVKEFGGLKPDREVGAYIDLELTLVNLEGRYPVLDFETIQLLSESNYIAFIRSDGDHFGRLTSILQIARIARDVETRVSNNLLKSIGELIGKTGHRLEEAVDKLEEFEQRLLETYLWDSIVDAWLDILIRPALLVQSLLGPTLVIYMGGDENLIVKPIVSCGEDTPPARLCNLLNTVLTIRGLVLTAGAEAIATLIRMKGSVKDSKVIDDVVELLLKSKVATTSAGVILVRPKFPAYTTIALLDRLVETAKECGRDATLVAAIQSTSGLLDTNTLVRESILSPIPNEENGVYLTGLADLLAYVQRHTELADVEKLVWSYVFRAGGDYRMFNSIADDILGAVMSMHRDRGAYIAVQTSKAIKRRCILAEKCPTHIRLALFNTAKLVEKGV